MRNAVEALAALGVLPPEPRATAGQLQKIEHLLNELQPPLSDAEAAALVPLLGEGGCFGLGWTVLHLIETAPGWPIESALQGGGEWVARLRERASMRPQPS